jgi:hypothetical protein
MRPRLGRRLAASLKSPGRNPVALLLVVLMATAALALWLNRDAEHVLRWIREHWLNAAAVTAAGTIALVAAAIVGPLPRRHPERSNREAAHQRRTMLRRVRNHWITHVLDPSLAGAAQLALGLQRRPDLLHLGSQVIRRPGQGGQGGVVGVHRSWSPFWQRAGGRARGGDAGGARRPGVAGAAAVVPW